MRELHMEHRCSSSELRGTIALMSNIMEALYGCAMFFMNLHLAGYDPFNDSNEAKNYIANLTVLVFRKGIS